MIELLFLVPTTKPTITLTMHYRWRKQFSNEGFRITDLDLMAYFMDEQVDILMKTSHRILSYKIM